TAENPEEKQKRFIMLWVLKEAHIKLMGTTIGAVKETPSFSISGNKIIYQGNDLFYSLYEGGGYVMAAAFERKEERDNLIIKNYNDVPAFTLTAVN
ncbi:MAG: 4-phosphopantetheinyl transferase family protein, partial [Spirochaetia bacterium]|nr:4-phosphopantetheinyl transferase family protein [Spirochaetia bacterium]